MSAIGIVELEGDPRIESSSGATSMTSVEIAEFCQKEHKNVLADIRRTLKRLGFQPAEFSARYLDRKGEARECIRLPRREALIVVSGYRLDVRAKIVDHLDALEKAQRRPMTMSEVALCNARALVELERMQAEAERRQLEQQRAIDAIASRLEAVEDPAPMRAINARMDLVEETAALKVKPVSCETKTEIRSRIHRQYGLPVWTIDEVLTQSPYRPPIFGMVKNQHEDAAGSSFAVYQIIDISKLFRRFVSECVRVSGTTFKHPQLDRGFKLVTETPSPTLFAASN